MRTFPGCTVATLVSNLMDSWT